MFKIKTLINQIFNNKSLNNSKILLININNNHLNKSETATLVTTQTININNKIFPIQISNNKIKQSKIIFNNHLLINFQPNRLTSNIVLTILMCRFKNKWINSKQKQLIMMIMKIKICSFNSNNIRILIKMTFINRPQIMKIFIQIKIKFKY